MTKIWLERTPEEKAEWLKGELEKVRQAKAILEHLETCFERWLKAVENGLV